jgi:hypothetical protein
MPIALPPPPPRIVVVIPSAVRAQPVTGRVFVFLSTDSTREPRLEAGGVVSIPFFGVDVQQLAPGTAAVLDRRAAGYPVQSLERLPAGDYYVQALVSVYTRFPRADGHTIWAHMERGPARAPRSATRAEPEACRLARAAAGRRATG